MQRLDAETISETILSSLTNFGLDLSKMVGQAYDGCSTMAGKVSGVRKRIQDKYPQANFYHCCSHRLNLVINDLNDVSEIRNSVGTMKEVITFFERVRLEENIFQVSLSFAKRDGQPSTRAYGYLERILSL